MYILLYSKYSRSCLRILDSVEQLNGMMGSPTPIVQLVCIDGKEIRKQILNSKSIEIKKVPCLLVVDDTTVEKYDGEKAFQWVSEIVQKISANSQPPPQPPPMPPPQTLIEIEPTVKASVSRPQKEQKRPQKRTTKKETRIEDLDDIQEEEEENDIKVKKPPIPIRNGAGSYVIDGDSSEAEEDSPYGRMNPTGGQSPNSDIQEKKSSGSKGVGILDLAFAMRQEREKENKDNNK